MAGLGNECAVEDVAVALACSMVHVGEKFHWDGLIRQMGFLNRRSSHTISQEVKVTISRVLRIKARPLYSL